MGEYIVSARKYRPQNFESVVGQAALTATLKNAIANNRLAHAYLFCGPRGVGKTSCARIFAKAINCLHPNEKGEPCEECESCAAFNEQRSFNIHELDAASNNSVDDIRNLVDQVRIPPQVGRYSVYIVDEVHMLSAAAFNAFLKTLEEPPAHAIFILATTEKHKIIPTILSRCQIYDFNRISVSDAIAHLQYVAKSEGIEAEEMALNVIAQKSDGAMRDALSIFDQVVSFCGDKVTYQQVLENLNVLDYEFYFRLTDALWSGDVAKALIIFDEILNKGFDAQFFVGGFASHLRDLLVSRDKETLVLLEVSDQLRERYSKQALDLSQEWLYAAIEVANDCDLNYRSARNRRLLVEVMMIRIAGLKSGVGLKKVKPELPIINAVATTPVDGNDNRNATATNPAVGERHQGGSRSAERLAAPSSGSAVMPRRPSVFSLKSAGEPHPVASVRGGQNQVAVPDSGGANPVDLSGAVVLWRKYANSLDKEAYVTNVMNNFLPCELNGDVLKVKVIHEIQLDAILPHKGRIEQFFLKHTGIGYVVMFEIDEEIMKEEAFTDEEKFRKLQETNADFRNLKEILKLELV